MSDERSSGGSVGATFDEVYRELRALAAGALRRQRADHTLQPTALVHEVWLKLERGPAAERDRGHFLATATRAMRQILHDHARARGTLKRADRAAAGQGAEVSADSIAIDDGGRALDVVALDESLTKLSGLDERHGRIAELRILGGLTIDEVAREIGVSPRTVDSDWRFVRAWLRKELGGE